MKIDNQGRILLVGELCTGYGIAGLARLNFDGTPDTTFAPEGKFILNLNNNSGTHYLTRCIPLDNSDILAAGSDFVSKKGDFMITRLTQNPTGVEGSNSEVPADFVLHQNYPNPFNPSTTINWQVPVSSHQTIKVYDMLVNEVATLVDEFLLAESYEVDFMADGLTSEVNFYKLQAGSFVAAKKMQLIK